MSDTLQTTIEAADAGNVGADGTAEPAAAVRTETVPPPSVGRTLRAAREAAHMSVAEVAQILKFSTRQIEALETDDFAALPGTTIVRGFVRSYAKLLKLDGAALLQMLDVKTPSAPADVRPPDNMGVASQPGTERQFSPLLSAAIVLALAALLLALWHFFGPGSGKATTTTIGQTPATAPPPVAPPPPEAVPQAGAAPATTPAAVENASSVATPAAAPGAVAAVPEQAATLAPALVFAFRDRCWVEVTDATKQKLHSGENPAGGKLTLSGKPPYDIVIGNAPKATLTYGDRPIDLAPHTRAEVARLILE